MAMSSFRKSRRFAGQFWRAWRADQAPKTRRIRFEPLETRELMASDFFVGTNSGSSSSGTSNYLSPSGEVSSSSRPEGHAAPDLVAFAKALTAANVKFYGADWCPICNQQKAVFEDGARFLNFIEATNPDRTPNTVGISANVTVYPTWEFQGGLASRQTGFLTLQQISAASGIPIPESGTPSIAPVSATTVLRGSPFHVPIDAYSPQGEPLTITVSSSNPSAITAEVLSGNSSARFETNFGPMIFELFDTEGGRAASRFKQLAQQGFYNSNGTTNMTFHRVIQNFVIQGGDPTATGTGGSSLPNFDDQFDLDLQHNRSGVLSYAKSSDDTNDSQFFITAGPTRNLDFNHSIFGQLVEGDSNRLGIARTSVGSNDKPIRDAIINSVTIFDDVENGLVRLRAVGTAGATSTITVTVRDAEGGETQTTFVATVANDTSNGSPFLNDIAPVNAVAGQATQIQLSAQDKEGDTLRFTAVKPEGQTANYTVSVNATSGLVTVTPPAGFVGSFQFLAGVSQTTNANANDQNDVQLVTVNVGASGPTAPTSIDLSGTSDSGASDSDNITNAGNLTFTISGTVNGATVTLRAGSNTIGTTVATGSVTTITTANLASLGSGTYALTATQTVGTQTSNASPALSVTFDNTSPLAITSSLIPSSLPAGQPLNVNLVHPEEGAGLVYGLVGAPAGMSVNSSTGVLSWTPTVDQIGQRNFSLTLTDTAGNVRSTDFPINVTQTAQARVRLEAVSNGQALTSVSVGQTFTLRVFADDLRASATGVFAAYFDLNFDSAIVELDGASPITRLNAFEISPSGGTSTPGLIDDFGAARSSTTASNLQEVVVAEIRFRAKAAGQVNFSTDAAEGTGRSILLYDINTAIPVDRIGFGRTSIAVGRNFVASNDSFNFNEDSSDNTLDVLANDTIVSGTGTTLTISAVGTPNSGGTVTRAPDNRSLRYTPVANFNGGETFTYTVRDNSGAEAIATVTVQVQPVNDPPVAVADTYTFVEGSNDNFLDVLLNDNDGVDDSESLSISNVGSPSQGGTARINGGSNAILYTPRAGFTGTETVNYTLRDNNGGTATTTVTITVNPRVPPPTAVNDSFVVIEDAVAADFDVLANDTPSQTGEILTVSGGTGNQGGVVASSTNGTRLRYTPRANFSGTELVTYTLRGSRGGQTTGTVTFTVTGVNDAPDAVNDSFNVLSQPNQLVNVLGNDINVDTGEAFTITALTQPASGQGMVSISNNQISYSAPSTSFEGTVSFTYTIGDGSNLSDTATVTLTVRNFVPRSIGGEFFLAEVDSAVSPDIHSFRLNFTGPALTGEMINRVLTVSDDGTFMAESLPPGTYTVAVPDLPFIANDGGSTQIVSNVSDGNTNALRLSIGTIQSRYIDVRDFLGSVIGRGVTAAIANGQSQQWLLTNGDWKSYSNINLSLNSAGTSLAIRATDSNNQVVTGTVSATDAELVSLRANEGSSQLLRLIADPSDLTLTPATTSGGEGEGFSAVDAAMSQISPQLSVNSPATDAIASNSSVNTNAVDSVFAQDIEDLTRRRR
jgi:large repetitive protein